MFDETYRAPVVQRDSTRNFTCEFFAAQGEALTNAARLLGGTPAALRVIKLAEELRDGDGPLSVHTLRRIERLHLLVSLSADEDEYDFSCALDPDDPRVHDICMLSDALKDHLRQMSEAKSLPDRPKKAFLV